MLTPNHYSHCLIEAIILYRRHKVSNPILRPGADFFRGLSGGVPSGGSRARARGARGARAPFFFDQNEARRAQKNFFGEPPPPPHRPFLSEGLDPPLVPSGSPDLDTISEQLISTRLMYESTPGDLCNKMNTID